MSRAVEIRDLAKHFGAFHAVDGITFDRAGQVAYRQRSFALGVAS